MRGYLRVVGFGAAVSLCAALFSDGFLLFAGEEPQAQIETLKVSGDGSVVLIKRTDNIVLFFDKNAKPLGSIEKKEERFGRTRIADIGRVLDLNSDGTEILVHSLDDGLKVVDRSGENLLLPETSGYNCCQHARFAGEYIVALGNELNKEGDQVNYFYIYSRKNGRYNFRFEAGEGLIDAFTVYPGEHLLAYNISMQNEIILVNYKSGNLIAKYEALDPVKIAISPSGEKLAYDGNRKKLTLVDYKKKNVIWQSPFLGNMYIVTDVAFSPKGDVYTCSGSTAYIFNAKGEKIQEFSMTPQPDIGYTCVISPAAGMFFTYSADKAVVFDKAGVSTILWPKQNP